MQVKAKSLCLTKHHAVKTYWGSGGIVPVILNMDRGEESSSHPSRFTAGERAPGTHWIGSRAGLGASFLYIYFEAPCGSCFRPHFS